MHRRLARNLLSTPAKVRPPGARSLVRFNSSQAGGVRAFNPALLVAACIMSSGMGYYVANTRPIAAATNLVDVEPSYGSANDFQQAIAELRSAFGADAVSTDPETLGPYGYSENDYHPRVQLHFSSSSF